MDEIKVEVKKDYLEGLKQKEICAKYNISINTLKSWIKRYKWADEKRNRGAPKNRRGAPFDDGNKETRDSKKPIEHEVKEVLENDELTDKQRLFCIYYIKCFNATKAYQKAYESDYTTANTNGPRLLVNACIKTEIERLKEGKLNRLMLKEEDIFQRYMDIAFSDITDYVSFGQEEVPVMGPFGPLEVEGEKVTKIINTVKFKESTEIDGTIISEVKLGKDGASIKLQDKMKALQWLSDRMDLLPTNIKLKLENENSKLELDVMKMELEIMKQGGQEDEVEDDGFIGALEAQVGDAWDD
ncbi:MAG: terminase small subunit [Paraclostridium sp.]